MVSNQKNFTTPFEEMTSPEKFARVSETRPQFYNKKSLTAIRQFSSVWIFWAATSSISCEDLTKLIFSTDKRINHFSRWVYHFVFSLNTRNKLWFLLLTTWWITCLFLALLHILRANLLVKYFLQSSEWIFGGCFTLLVWYFPFLSVACCGYLPRRFTSRKISTTSHLHCGE